MFRGAEDLKDISYAQLSSAQRLDLYLPARNGAAVPLVINLHGGTFVTGDKNDEMYNVAALRARGYAVANLNFRLAGAAYFPEGAQDVKAAVRWLRANASQYGLDANRFAAWGSAAGAYMASMLGVSSGQATLFDAPTLGNSGVSDAVQAVVVLYGPTNFKTMDWQLAAQGCGKADQAHDNVNSPESLWVGGPVQTNARADAATLSQYVNARNAEIPPFYFFHGGKDCSVPLRQSYELAESLRGVGVSAEVMEFPDAGHAADAVKNGSLTPAIAFLDRMMTAIGPVPPTGNIWSPTAGTGGAGSAGSGGSGGGTMDANGVTQVPPTVIVNGRNITVSGVVTWDRPINFYYRQIAIRPPQDSKKDGFSLAFSGKNESMKGQITLTGTGTCDEVGTWTAFETYSINGKNWSDGPKATFYIGN